MKKALLIYARFSDYGFWNYRQVCELMNARYPAAPLGMITLAALLPKDWNLRLIDMNCEELNDSDIDEADLVFTGGMLPQQLNMLALIDRVQSRGKKIVLGGPDPSSQPEVYQKADFLVLGEAEVSLPPFLADLEKGASKGTYLAPEKPDITTSPVPRYDLLNFDNYLMVGVQFCRGCPFTCEFCDIIELYGRKPRTKTSEQVIAELETLYQLGYRGHVDFVDDNFIGNKTRVKEILRDLMVWSEKRNYPFYYSTEASLNLADDDELLEMMKKLDFRYVFVGIETPDPELLKSMQKRQNVNRGILEELEKIYSYGIIVNAGFILGFDNEHDQSARLMAEVIDSGKIGMAMVGLLYALPNTALTRRLRAENRLGENLNQLDADQAEVLVDQTSSGLNFVTLRPREQVLSDYLYILRSIYGKKNYFKRVLALSLSIHPKPRHRPPVRNILRSGRAFFRLIYRLGMKPATAWYFWSNIAIVLVKNPVAVEQCVNLMAMYLHFSQQTRFISGIVQKNIDHLKQKQA